MTAIPADLHALLQAVEASERVRDLPEPPMLPPNDDADLAVWLAAVAKARKLHDAAAVQRRVAIDEAARELFGASASDRLQRSRAAGSLRSANVQLPIEPAPQLADFAPSLHEAAPTGRSPYAAGTTVTARCTWRQNATKPLAVVVRLHGGAYWMAGGETARMTDAVCIEHFALSLDAMIVDLDYRLAPEHPFPAGIADTLHTLDWIRNGELARAIGPAAPAIDGSRTGLFGASSGANLAVQAARVDVQRQSADPLAALVLTVPSLQLVADDRAAGSARERLVQAYAGPGIDPADPWISPAMLPAIRRLPPSLIVLGDFDEVVRGGEAFASAITNARGSVLVQRYPMTHTIATPTVECEWIEATAAFLAEHLRAARQA